MEWWYQNDNLPWYFNIIKVGNAVYYHGMSITQDLGAPFTNLFFFVSYGKKRFVNTAPDWYPQWRKFRRNVNFLSLNRDRVKRALINPDQMDSNIRLFLFINSVVSI